MSINGEIRLLNGNGGNVVFPVNTPEAVICEDGSTLKTKMNTFANVNHSHASDSSKVSTSTTINGKALSSNVTLTLDDIADGVARKLGESSVDTSQLIHVGSSAPTDPSISIWIDTDDVTTSSSTTGTVDEATVKAIVAQYIADNSIDASTL